MTSAFWKSGNGYFNAVILAYEKRLAVLYVAFCGTDYLFADLCAQLEFPKYPAHARLVPERQIWHIHSLGRVRRPLLCPCDPEQR